MASSSNNNNNYNLPASLTSLPVYNTCPPGECQFTDQFTKVPLLENIPVSKTSFVARFGLPDTKKPLGLSTCACILAGVEIDGEMVVRPYTPISTNADVGTFDLLIKQYPDGKMSSFIGNLEPNSEEAVVAFKHIPFNVKIQYPFCNNNSKTPKFIAMIAGGTGITPMIQALHAILGDDSNSDIEKVHLLYGSRSVDDILGREMIDHWANKNDKFDVTHVLSNEDDGVDLSSDKTNFEKGFINKELIESVVPSAAHGDNVIIFVCGPPVMYDILCGARGEDEVTGVLGEMGYSSSQVYKF